MPGLSLIVGPPNSGRAGEVRERLLANADRDPLLVVPTRDDAERFERDLCPTGGAMLGLGIRTFRWLVEDVVAATGARTRPSVSPAQRLWLVHEATRRSELRLLDPSSRRRGFAPALERLISELQAALFGPDDLERAAAALDDGGNLERELCAAYRAYLALRDGAALGDAHSTAAAATGALRAAPQAWGARPVFLYGFDDLTEEQLALVAELAEAAEVTVAVNYADREALAARADLLSRLLELGAERPPDLPSDREYTASPILRHLDRHLFEPGAQSLGPDAGLALLESAGDRGEAEALAAEIASLLAGDVDADDIVVVLRHPDRHGPLLQGVLSSLAIPVAVEARVGLGRSAVGRALLALIRAASEQGSAGDLLDLMRARPDTPASIADWLERRIRREGVATAAEVLAGWSAPPPAIAQLDRAPQGEALRVLARLAREFAESPHARSEPVDGSPRAEGSAAPAIPFRPFELRAALAAATTLEDLASVSERPGIEPPGLEAAADALEETRVPLWHGPTEGRVRVISPYRARAARARHLFVASLQDGEFPAAGAAEPLLSDRRRAALGEEPLKREEPGREERYLFHACVSRPTDRLWLSWKSSDEDGRPTPRSPFVDDVLDLVADPVESVEGLIRRRNLTHVVLDPSEAPTPRALERARAALGPRRPAVQPGPLRHPGVLGELAERNPVGAGTLEKWIECSYRWFVDHELRPQRLEPTPEPLTAGSIVHGVLERLYREPPGEDRIPRPGDLGRWRERARELLPEVSAEQRLDSGRPLAPVTLARMRAQIERFLEHDASSETDLRPALLEASFGGGEDADRPPLELGELRLHGMIDRVDVTPDGRFGVVRDYKTSARVPAGAKLEDEGKLQLQLYAEALRRLWEIEPVGGIYHPLARREGPKPRGFLLEGFDSTDALEAVGTDRLEGEELAATIEAGVERAVGTSAAMRAGEIDRDPNQGRCPSWCRYQAICRLERSIDANGGSNGESGGGGR